MKFQTNANIIPVFKGIITAVTPYARANQVNLIFKPNMSKLNVAYHPEEIIIDITQLICNVIAFTPQTFSVELILTKTTDSHANYLLVEVKNTGSNLSRLREITSGLKHKVLVFKFYNSPHGVRSRVASVDRGTQVFNCSKYGACGNLINIQSVLIFVLTGKQGKDGSTGH